MGATLSLEEDTFFPTSLPQTKHRRILNLTGFLINPLGVTTMQADLIRNQPVFLMPAAIPLIVKSAPRSNSPLL